HENRKDNIIFDSTFSSKNIFDEKKKQALLNNFEEEEKPEIISFESRLNKEPKKEYKKEKETPVSFSEFKDFETEDSFDEIIVGESDDDYIEYSPYNAPPVELLHAPKVIRTDDYEDYEEKANELEKVLEDFKIFAKVVNITPSSSVTRYELQMPPGMPVARILNRADDIAMALSSVGDVRIEAPIPGKSLLGIEVPNKKRKIIVIKEVLDTKEFFEAKSKMAFPLGRDINGNNYVVDIARMPHLLIAGATGSGKSVCLNSLIISLLYRAGPEDLRIILIDPKRVEFNIYADIPHLLIKSIINEQDKAISAFNWAIEEMERRFALFKKKNAKDIDSYNDRIDKSAENKLARILIVVDELAELMSSKKAGEVEEKIQRLAQLSRAAGIHLVLATQRPSVDVITGLIKANMPSRIAFRVISQVDSRTIMDYAGAEKLLGDGDMIFTSANTPKPVRMQCPYISIEEMESVIEYVKSNNDAYFDDDVFDSIMSQKAGSSGHGNSNLNSDDIDPYLLEVLKLAIESNQISISMVQRRFAVGYARAGKIIDDLERQGLISPLDGSKPRQVLITMDEFNRRFGM
ncbi:MAG: FtsK/SpoIIIE domain-containing protein, partial [Firmicutes bacterium]|nr:FtsK/SpoIIIE domain-containing protein [Bacillota bacterium]